MRYEQTATVADGDADEVFSDAVAELLRREPAAEVDGDSRVAAWRASGPGGGCAGQLYVTDARPRGVRITVTVETCSAAAVRALATWFSRYGAP
ncbi:hypothetical protein [Streptomyces sp. 891-h]|uniref:hypothetical protein n=1 Tax=unclassified Streptomyces TaxID=2593676 RepID=UPI001FAACA52|nr:hypothetical protein [Streptomyces sp. 891-h]UNZ16483.1 hypothetical protein HC362_04730 [Streptomyces sp. 891-h]